MRNYRFFTLDVDGKVSTPAKIFSFEDDGAAMKAAKGQLDGHGIEVWQGARLIIDLASKDE
jgi:3-deoxy-D-manno-octulosonate 8-phosphate phosphatase KdsC-like HAD superfamily phosphatase